MFKKTFNRALYWSIGATLVLCLYFTGCFDWMSKDSLKNFFEGYIETRTCYTDLEGDVLENCPSFFFENSDGYEVRMNLEKNWDGNYLKEGMALILNNNPHFDDFENKTIAGYYSVGFIVNTKFLGHIASSYNGYRYSNNEYKYFGAVIDFNKILKGYINDKSWRDIGIDLDYKISIKNPYGEGSFWNELVNYQILIAISGKTEINKELFMEYEEQINAILEKMSNEEVKDYTVKIAIEQSSYFCFNRRLGYATSQSVAAVPIYICWNNEYFDNVKSAIIEDTFNLKYYGYLRSCTNTKYSNAYNENREYAVDSANLVIVEDYVYQE